jgi:hypothetical protein
MELPQQLARAIAGRLEDDAALRVGDVLEMDVEAIGRQRIAGAIGPFDHGDASAIEGLLASRSPIRSVCKLEWDTRSRFDRSLSVASRTRSPRLSRGSLSSLESAALKDEPDGKADE